MRTLGSSRVGHARIASPHVVVVAVAPPAGLDPTTVAQPALRFSFTIFEATWIPVDTHLEKVSSSIKNTKTTLSSTNPYYKKKSFTYLCVANTLLGRVEFGYTRRNRWPSFR